MSLPNPWTDGHLYDQAIIAGVVFEGPVEVSGALWKKRNDHRRARGRNGGRSTATGWDLVDFTVTLSAWDDASHEAINAIIDRLGTRTPSRQDTNAIALSHAQLDAAGITQALLDEMEVTPPQRGGVEKLRLKLKEYRPPTGTASVTRTPAAAAQAAESRVGRFGSFEQRNADGTVQTYAQEGRMDSVDGRNRAANNTTLTRSYEQEASRAPQAPAPPSTDP